MVHVLCFYDLLLVCFNSSHVGPTSSRRGLRQGDPLSPYFSCVWKVYPALSPILLLLEEQMTAESVLEHSHSLTYSLLMTTFYSLKQLEEKLCYKDLLNRMNMCWEKSSTSKSRESFLVQMYVEINIVRSLQFWVFEMI